MLESTKLKGCCVSRDDEAALKCAQKPALLADLGITPIYDYVSVPGGVAIVGTSRPLIEEDGESPIKRKKVRELHWERGPITVGAFERFVQGTGYLTDAEQFGWSFVFFSHLSDGHAATMGVDGLEWWRRVEGACWRMPYGPQGQPADSRHPVTHVSWNDAQAYAKWAGGRLPREQEWEHAARGGLGDVRFPWGNEEPDDDVYFPCNIWQGNFPMQNTGADGYIATAPAISFKPNGFGLFNMVGNVWEWQADNYMVKSLKKTARIINKNAKGARLLKGGSYLCHKDYCYRYRIAARTGNTPDSTSSHMGFRVVYDSPQ